MSASILSWSAIYWIASAGVLAMGVMFYRALPGTQPHSQLAYRSLLASLWTVFAQQPALRRATLTAKPDLRRVQRVLGHARVLSGDAAFHMPSYVAGLFGVIGVAGAFVAPIVGKLADRRGVAIRRASGHRSRVAVVGRVRADRQHAGGTRDRRAAARPRHHGVARVESNDHLSAGPPYQQPA